MTDKKQIFLYYLYQTLQIQLNINNNCLINKNAVKYSQRKT